MPKRSEVWLHFDKSADGKSAKCRHCAKIIQSSGNTSNFQGHLNSIHSNVLIKKKKSEDEPSSKKQDENEMEAGPTPSTSTSSTSDVSSMETRKPATTPVPLKQPSIVGAINKIESFKHGGKNAEKITEALLYMVCRDLEPFSIVERRGFIKFMKCLAPHYNVPSRFTLKRLVQNKFKAVSLAMKKEISNKKCTLTTDAWTDVQMRSFLSLTVHFIDDQQDQLFSGTVV